MDVPLSTFDQAMPGSQLGFSGYKMVITPTGNTILHPRLEQQQQHYIEVSTASILPHISSELNKFLN